jgi:hypothetical protein
VILQPVYTGSLLRQGKFALNSPPAAQIRESLVTERNFWEKHGIRAGIQHMLISKNDTTKQSIQYFLRESSLYAGMAEVY